MKKTIITIISLMLVCSMFAFAQEEDIVVPEEVNPPFLQLVWAALEDLQSQIDSFFDIFVKNEDVTDWDQDVFDDFSGSWNDLADIPPGFADNVDDVGEGSCPITEEEYYDMLVRLNSVETELCLLTDSGFYCNTGKTCCSWYFSYHYESCVDSYVSSIPTNPPDGNLELLPCVTPAQATNPDYALCYNPGEICDGIDNNCDGIIDEGC